MKKLLLIIVLFSACSYPETRLKVVNLTDPDTLLWREHSQRDDIWEVFITLKDSCIYVTKIQNDAEFHSHEKVYCF